jgi:hypothetical protein
VKRESKSMMDMMQEAQELFTVQRGSDALGEGLGADGVMRGGGREGKSRGKASVSVVEVE